MRNWIAGGLLAIVAACSPATPPGPTAAEIATASADINKWFDAQYEEELQMSPISLTVQGRKDMYGELDDMSEAAQDKHLDWRRKSVAEMKAKFDPAKRTTMFFQKDSKVVEEPFKDVWSLIQANPNAPPT